MSRPDGEREGDTTELILGGARPGKRFVRIGLLGSFLLPLAPFVTLARFGGFEVGETRRVVLDAIIWLTSAVPVLAWLSGLLNHPRVGAFSTSGSARRSF